MATALSIVQEISLYRPHGTVWDGTYLHVVAGSYIHSYTRAGDGTLSIAASTNMGRGNLSYITWDGTYLHVRDGSPRLFAVLFDGVTHTKTGNDYARTVENMDANSNGIIMVANNHSTYIRKLSFDGVDYVEEGSCNRTHTNSVYAMRIDAYHCVVCTHTSGSNNTSLVRVSDCSLLDEITLDEPDGCVVNGDIVAVADANYLRVYDISSGVYVLKAYAYINPTQDIMDNIDYDGNNNFHIYKIDSIQHVYWSGSGLEVGEELAFGKGSRVTWQSSTNVGSYFYVTHIKGYLIAIKRASGSPVTSYQPKIMSII